MKVERTWSVDVKLTVACFGLEQACHCLKRIQEAAGPWLWLALALVDLDRASTTTLS